MLGFVGLGEFIDRMPSELSGGQRRRVAIARAMAAKPRILLYDEPTTGLDPITSLTVDEEIIKLRDLEGVSSILVTHQLRDAFFVAEHTARARTGTSCVFEQGRGPQGGRSGVHHAEGRPHHFEGNATSCARRPRTIRTSRRFSRTTERTHHMPRTRSLAWSELKIGIIAVAALALAALLILAVGGASGFSWQRYDLKTRFPDVQGLKSGAVVRVAGVEVGKVTRSSFAAPDVEVALEVKKENQSRITTESRASIGSLSLLGEPVIDISPSRRARRSRTATPSKPVKHAGQLSDVAESATQSLGQSTALLEGHPRRQGHGRQAVHRRRPVPRDQRVRRRRRSSVAATLSKRQGHARAS